MDKMLTRGYLTKNGVGYDVNSRALLIIKLPDSRVLSIMSRSLFLTMLLLALPCLIKMMNGASLNTVVELDNDLDGFKILPVLLRDLLDEGLIKKGHKGFIYGSPCTSQINDDLKFLNNAGIDLLNEEMKPATHQVFDFIFVPSFYKIKLIDGILKENGGLVISPLGHDPTNELRHYKTVYLRRLKSTVVAMRKTSDASISTSTKRVLCGVTLDEKKTALNGLEDVYLEPPTMAKKARKSKKLIFTSRKIKFLPELLRDSLDGYPQRFFISDDVNALDWFEKNYPMQDQEFQVYDVEKNDKPLEGAVNQEDGLSTWLKTHVRGEDYVVMKAEAQVVEEMLNDKTLSLVDELFLECKNQWAYWQCIALYGKVRDEGIAVHQWWN